ncbi:S-adenosyl-L-methionine-dependent methyltransferase [Melanogaster broomeanus]|nr:S-adenosyl-L-methionine-dependent methyltransferase [Melanogaster broomeanus]
MSLTSTLLVWPPLPPTVHDKTLFLRGSFLNPTVSTTETYRTTHSYPGALYLLPSDNDEKERLARQYQLYKTLFGGRIVFPTISFPPNSAVLDVGTGSATWLTDCRSQLPESVQFYGIDIEAKLFPAYSISPPNTHFSIGSATKLPWYWTSKFTLVNQRLLILALTKDEWKECIQEIHRVLKEGGYAQFVEIDSRGVSGSKTAAHAKFLSSFLGAKGLDIQCCDRIPELMAAAGFVDIHTEEVFMKVGEWAGQLGREARDASIGAMRGMKGPVMKAGGMGYVTSGEEFDRKMDEIAEEWDRTEGSYRRLKLCYGVKPSLP